MKNKSLFKLLICLLIPLHITMIGILKLWAFVDIFPNSSRRDLKKRLFKSAYLVYFKEIKINKPKNWIVLASLGEAKAAWNFIESKQNDYLFLAQTQSALEYLKSQKAFCIYLPCEQKSIYQFIYNNTQPQKIIFWESEIWPFLILWAFKNQIRLEFWALNFKDSFYSHFFYSQFVSHLLIYFNKIHCGSDQSLDWVNKNIRLAHIQIIPWTHSLKIIPLSQNKISHNAQIPSRDFLFLSVHLSEINELKSLLKKYPHSIIAPRDLHLSRQWIQKLNQLQIPFSLYPKQNPHLLCLVLEYGLINTLLPQVKAVFMGGSFAPHIGIHNIWEPLAYFVPIIHGEYSFLLQTHLNELQKLNWCTSVQNICKQNTTESFAELKWANQHKNKTLLTHYLQNLNHCRLELQKELL